MLIRPLEDKDSDRVRDFYRLQLGDAHGSLAREALKGSAGVAAEDREKGFLAVGFMKSIGAGRYDLVDVAVRPDYRNMGLENQMLLTLEILAGKQRGLVFGVWVKSDACDDFSYDDINDRMRYVERGYVFTAYRANRFGPGHHADRFDKELPKEITPKPFGKHRSLDTNISMN